MRVRYLNFTSEGSSPVSGIGSAWDVGTRVLFFVLVGATSA